MKGDFINVEKLLNVINETTKAYRKGESVNMRDEGGYKVMEIFNYPHTSEVGKAGGMKKIDMVFIDVVVDLKAADRKHAELESLMRNYPNIERLTEGPSYIELANELGINQDYALRLMALGDALEMWRVIHAKTLFHVSSRQAMEMAKKGFLLIYGYETEHMKEKLRS